MAETSIEWTDYTFNPWRGCARVSRGCEHCYAEAFAKRVGFTGNARPSGKPVLPVIWGAKADRVIASESYWRAPLRWNRTAEKARRRARVFCASMADVFEERDDLVAPRARLFRIINETPHLDWLLLTKRPENVTQLAYEAGLHHEEPWPENIWLGTTCEDQKRADERIPHLLATPAAVRFVSYEPALGAVDFTRGHWECTHCDVSELGHAEDGTPWCLHCDSEMGHRSWLGDENGIDWIIVGGESGPGARPFDLAWARSTVEQCREARVACFVKQLGAKPCRYLHTELGMPSRLELRDPKGGAIEEWPEDLRVREWPNGGHAAKATRGAA